MIKVAKLPEPMPMMLVGIPRPGIDVPVYPTGSLVLPEAAEGWTAEQLLEEGIERVLLAALSFKLFNASPG